MKQLFVKYIAAFFLPVIIVSCSKNNDTPQGVAALTIVNAVVGSNKLVTNFSGEYALSNYYINANAIPYNAFYLRDHRFNSYNGMQKLALYQFPDTLSKSQPLFDLTLDLPAGSINTLFLTGMVDAPDTLFTVDHPPYYSVQDSVTGIRFVNLSPGSKPISINLEGQAFGSEAGNLSYKTITGFKTYAATSDVSSYTFEFRDAETGTLLTKYVAERINADNSIDLGQGFNLWRFRNSTLVFLGLPGGQGDSVQTVLWVNSN